MTFTAILKLQELMVEMKSTSSPVQIEEALLPSLGFLAMCICVSTFSEAFLLAFSHLFSQPFHMIFSPKTETHRKLWSSRALSSTLCLLGTKQGLC